MKNKHSGGKRLRRLVTAGILVAAAMILSWIEFILPFSIGIPGVKLGLCHMVTLLAIYRLSAWEAAAVTAVRIALTAVLFGSVASLAYSAAGGAVSLAVMLLLIRLKRQGKPVFSPFGVSIAGAVTHNMAQLLTAAALMQTPLILSYFPVLVLAGTVTGALIGHVSAVIQSHL